MPPVPAIHRSCQVDKEQHQSAWKLLHRPTGNLAAYSFVRSLKAIMSGRVLGGKLFNAVRSAACMPHGPVALVWFAQKSQSARRNILTGSLGNCTSKAVKQARNPKATKNPKTRLLRACFQKLVMLESVARALRASFPSASAKSASSCRLCKLVIGSTLTASGPAQASRKDDAQHIWVGRRIGRDAAFTSLLASCARMISAEMKTETPAVLTT